MSQSVKISISLSQEDFSIIEETRKREGGIDTKWCYSKGNQYAEKRIEKIEEIERAIKFALDLPKPLASWEFFKQSHSINAKAKQTVLVPIDDRTF